MLQRKKKYWCGCALGLEFYHDKLRYKIQLGRGTQLTKPSIHVMLCFSYSLSLQLIVQASTVYTSPESEPTLKRIAGLQQVWRHITVYMVLTPEEIPEEGR